MSNNFDNICPVCGEFSDTRGYEYICPNSHVWRYCNGLNHEVPKKIVTSIIGEDTSGINYRGCCCNLDKLNGHINSLELEIENPVPQNININFITPEGVKIYTDKSEAEKHKQEYLKSVIDQYNSIMMNAGADDKPESKPKNPTPKYPPMYVSSKSKHLWPEFCKSYSKYWKDYTETGEKWAVAVAIWRNYCNKRNLPAFEDTPQDGESAEYMSNRIKVARTKSIQAVGVFTRKIPKEFIEQVLRETFCGIETTRNGIYTVVTTRKIKAKTDFKNQKFRNWLKECKFVPKNGKFFKEVNGLCKLIIEMWDADMYLTTTYDFPEQLVAMALSIPQDTIRNNKDKVSKQLSTHFRALMREIKN